MARKLEQTPPSSDQPSYQLPISHPDWQALTAAIAARYNREYQREAFELPPEVEAMPLFHEWASGRLQSRMASAFWELSCPQKNQHWLDIGCGLSFLIYPWRDWNAYFYGLEISSVAREALQSRGPQLNSKLFRGVTLGAAHQSHYDAQQFDGAIATGWSCYYPLAYWQVVLPEIRRVLKPDGILVMDVIDPERELAEDWAILETYFGAEALLTPLQEWKTLIREAGGTLAKTMDGELFQMLKIRF